jgi:hypothetical protein
MLRTIQTRIKHGQILLSKDINIPDDTLIFVSFKDNSSDDYFLKASESALDKIWDNSEDDIYEKLLKK